MAIFNGGRAALSNLNPQRSLLGCSWSSNLRQHDFRSILPEARAVTVVRIEI
jgi:hypothetical protein